MVWLLWASACGGAGITPPSDLPVNDLSGIPVALEASIQAVSSAPQEATGAGVPQTTATEVGAQITARVEGVAVCGASGLTTVAQRVDTRVLVSLQGGEPCAAGRVGALVLQITDRPGNTRGRVLEVSVGGAPLPSVEITPQP